MDLNINLNVTFNGNKVDKILDFFRELFLKKEVPAQLPTEEIHVQVSEQKAEEPAQLVPTQARSEEEKFPISKEKLPRKKVEKTRTHAKLHRFVKKLTDKNKDDLLSAAQMLDEQYNGKTLSYQQFMSRLIKMARVPLCSFTSVLSVLDGQVDLSWYHRNLHQNSPALAKDAAVLLRCGIPISVVRILTEQSLEVTDLSYALSLAGKVTDDDVISVYCKYQKDLEIFGISDISFDPDWKDKLETHKKSTRHRPRFTYDEVNRLVVYYDAAVKKGLKGEKAVIEAGKQAEIKACTSTLKSLIFDHKSIPGYASIPTPTQQKEREDVRVKETLYNVMKVKFLFHKRGMDFNRIAEETGMKRITVSKICKGITYSQVTIDADTERVFEAKYPKMTA